MNKSSTSSGGIGFVSGFLITFIVLKLTGYVDWSWLWILSPLWIAGGIAIFVVAVYIGIAVLVEATKK